MKETEKIELAKAYVALSNSHRLALVLAMFSEVAVYHSPHVGEFVGRRAIGKMMSDFFGRFPDVHWRASDYLCDGDGVGFEFAMNATEASTGSRIERRGEELIEFNEEGLITSLQVMKGP